MFHIGLTWSWHAICGWLGLGDSLSDGRHGSGGWDVHGLSLKTNKHFTVMLPTKETVQTCKFFCLTGSQISVPDSGMNIKQHFLSNLPWGKGIAFSYMNAFTLPSAPCPPSGPLGMDKETSCREKLHNYEQVIFIMVARLLHSTDRPPARPSVRVKVGGSEAEIVRRWNGIWFFHLVNNTRVAKL